MARKKHTDPTLSTPGINPEDPLESRLLQWVASKLSDEGKPEETVACEKSLYAFVKAAWPIVNPAIPFIETWHVGCVAEHLQAMTNLEIKRLVINCPPRSSKSFLCSVFWPAWVWATNPTERWLYASYGDALAKRDSVYTRDVITSQWYQEQWGGVYQIREDSNVKTFFTNDKTGYRIATTITGKGIGLGANRVVVDDPIKPLEIHSEVKCQLVLDWWDKTMSSRVEQFDTTTFLITHQRLKENDLSGHVLASGLGWECLCIPMEYEANRIVYSLPLPDPLPRDAIVPTSLQRRRPELMDPRKEEGELMAPDLIGPRAVLELKATLGSDASGQLQQRPTAASGAVFQSVYFRYFGVHLWQGEACVFLGEDDDPLARRIPIRMCRFFQCADTATDIKQSNAFTAVGTFALTPTYDLLVWHMWREKLLVLEIFEALQALRTGPVKVLRMPDGRTAFVPDGNPWPQMLLFQAVEKKSSGIGLIQEGAAYGMPFEVLNTGSQDKVARAAAIGTLYHTGKVWHRRGQKFLPDLEDELLRFPLGKYADQVDTLSYAGIKAMHDRYLRLSVDRPTAYIDEALVNPGTGMVVRADVDSNFVTLRLGNDILSVEFPEDD